MLDLVKYLLFLNGALLNKGRGIVLYDKAIALHAAEEYAAAVPLMIEAAELGNLDAMTVLGSMYLLGLGVKEDGPAAERWLKKAVDAGYDGAISLLGMAYATGKAGIVINIPRAREMLELASANGDEKSAQMLRMMDNGEGLFAKLKTRKTKKH